jgi:hypothetical protein
VTRHFLIGISLAGFVSGSSAQTTTYGPLALRLPASARALAMGDIAVAGRDDDVIFYNPAQLAIARGTSMSFVRMAPDQYGGTMSTVLRLGSGGLGIGVNFLEYRVRTGIYPVSRDDILDPQPGSVSGTSTLATLGFAQAYRGFRIGASANYAVDEIGIDRFRNIVGDVGLARDFNRFTAALALQHLGSPMQINPPTAFAPSTNPLLAGDGIKPPMQATLGLGWVAPAGPFDLTATAAVSAMREGHLSPGIGGEASWSWLSGYAVSARAGVRHPHEVGDATYTGGVGFVADRVALDIAAEVLNNNHVGYRAGFRVR